MKQNHLGYQMTTLEIFFCKSDNRGVAKRQKADARKLTTKHSENKMKPNVLP